MIRPLLAVCLLCPLPVLAGAVHVTVHRSGATYLLNLVMLVNVDRAAAYAMMTDDDHLSRLTDVITASSRLQDGDPARHRHRIVTRTCILVFCMKAVLVEDVRLSGGDEISSTIVPGSSDFATGSTEWRFSPADSGGTRIDVKCNLRPKFWVPPVIGTWLIRRKLVVIGTQIASRMEALAARG